MDFHAHIYYTFEEREIAVDLHRLIQHCFGGQIEIYPLVDRLVGPHLWPMFELEFSQERYAQLIPFLDAHRGDLPVLIHPLTPNEIANHGALARWLGPELPLNWSRLSGAA